MTDPNTPQKPELPNLVEASKPTRMQTFMNFFGLGYGGNTAVSVVAVGFVRKTMPGLVAKWEAKHARKFYDRKVEEQITPVADQLTAETREILEAKIRGDSIAYGEKTVNARLLSVGGFAMLPFQSAKEIADYGKNVGTRIDQFRDEYNEYTQTTPGNHLPVEDEIRTQLDAQRQHVRPGGKADKLLQNATEKPKFSPLGPDARQDLPKWAVARCAALGAAFSVQTIVDDRFKKPKDAVDHVIAKVVTRIVNPGSSKESGPRNQALNEEAQGKGQDASIDPKILNVVRMITTDAYMTSIGLLTMHVTKKSWEKQEQRIEHRYGKSPMEVLRDKFSRGSAEQTL
jgi:hypothetical protein